MEALQTLSECHFVQRPPPLIAALALDPGPMEITRFLSLVPAQPLDCLVGKAPPGCPVLPTQASGDEHRLWGQMWSGWWRRQWHPTLVLVPGKSCGWRSLVGCSPWGRKELDMTDRLHFHFSVLRIGEGNGNPLQCSCLENPRVGVAQSQTRLKRLSSSNGQVGKPLCYRACSRKVSQPL